MRIEMEGMQAARELLGSKVGKQVRFALAKSLTQTASLVKREMPALMDAAFEGGATGFTKRGIYTKAARTTELQAEVGVMPLQAAYLQYQVRGGRRAPDLTRLQLPSNIKLDRYGNIPKGIVKSLVQAAKGGELSKKAARRLQAHGNRRKGAAPVQLFYGKPKGQGWAGAPVGIWRRIPALSGGVGKLVPVVVFPKQAASYRPNPRFDFDAIVATIVRREHPALFAAALRDALATAR